MAEKETTTSTARKDGERKCKVCNMTFPDIYAYTDHLESKEHTSGIMKKKYGEKYLEAKAKLSGSQNSEEDKNDNSEDKSNSDDDEGEVYTCEVCKKVCTGLLSYKLHLSGKKHKKNLKKTKLLKEMQKDKLIPQGTNTSDDNPLMDTIFTQNPFSANEILCKVCNKKCTGPETFKIHQNSESHKKKLASQNLLKELKLPNRDPESSDNDEPTEIAHCDVCSKGFSGPLPYKQHMESTSHSKQVKQSEKMATLKDLYISEDDDKIQCKECKKYFSGPKPFQDHLKSALHMKQKKKVDLIKSLQEQYPEMVISSNLKDENSDSSDSDKIIHCKICHRAFSGPESARDHFISKNHKKTKKEKKRIQTLKTLKNGENTKGKSRNSNGAIFDTESDEDGESEDSFQVLDAEE